jgi:hypothetical protein
MVMLRHTLIALAGAITLASCAIDPKPFVGPNGKAAYSMECSGSGRTLAACYQKAGQLCPAGYNIVGTTSGTVAVPVYGGGILAAPDYGLAIECK